MRYIFGVFVPLILQGLLMYIIIDMNTDNGSWLGLGAVLVGSIAMPGTAVANFVYCRKYPEKPDTKVIGRCFLHAMVAPFIVLVIHLFA